MLIFIAILAAVSAGFGAYLVRQFVTRELEPEPQPVAARTPSRVPPQPVMRPLGDHRLDCADILRAIGAGR